MRHRTPEFGEAPHKVTKRDHAFASLLQLFLWHDERPHQFDPAPSPEFPARDRPEYLGGPTYRGIRAGAGSGPAPRGAPGPTRPLRAPRRNGYKAGAVSGIFAALRSLPIPPYEPPNPSARTTRMQSETVIGIQNRPTPPPSPGFGPARLGAALVQLHEWQTGDQDS